MHYAHCLCNVHNQSTAICRQMLCVDIEVEYFCDNIIYHYPISVCIFLSIQCTNLVWNWYGSMEDCLPFHSWNLPFHSILASSIFHIEISVPFHSIFHFIPFHNMPWLLDILPEHWLTDLNELNVKTHWLPLAHNQAHSQKSEMGYSAQNVCIFFGKNNLM